MMRLGKSLKPLMVEIDELPSVRGTSSKQFKEQYKKALSEINSFK
jgi:hypothetical protein